ncbi:S8 family serine peptidase [Marinicella litoralis]|uniref:Subtilisin family serine protease n=1 Tax=Marinicella litoralis TaxID=644220 RepID=A0A4R6XIN6_9GAMM|nr:S8 family serine peptidase [Marinicella litoralis]TDR19346.1 subtilisin family serine protease [Marinicella litoralis]
MKFTMKKTCVATMLALGTFAQAERMIVSHHDNGNGLKNGHQVLVQGDGWFAVELDENGKSAMRGKSGFKNMEVDAKRYPLSIYNDDAGDPTLQQLKPYAIYQSQADQLSLQPGQKVCVIDSGLDASNNDFEWSNITGDNDSGTGNWFDHGGPHGTHVAGTIAAADNNIGVVGMAPGVPLHIIKVFNAAGWGYSSDLAYAAQKCTDAGANIISMSLGGGGANSIEENAFDTFIANGGLVVAAAGNDGNSVRSYPAGYSSVMMIGANDADNNIADFSQFPSCTSGRGKKVKTDETICVEVTAGGVDTFSTYPAGLATLSSATADGAGVASSAMENVGSASGSTYYMGTAESTDGGAAGKICLIDRGVISFHDKVANCENSGGAGAIIINNEPGMLYGTLGDPNATSIPAVGAAFEDRTFLLGASTASVSIGASDYGYMSGTSMATPAVAGVAALVWSNHADCTGQEIRDALKASAEDAGASGKDDYFGYGIVKAKAASDYLTANGCEGGVTEPPGGTDMTLTGSRSNGNRKANLSWTGGTTANVDVYINGSLNNTTVNDGSATYNVSKNSTYTFSVCEEGSTVECTNEITL